MPTSSMMMKRMFGGLVFAWAVAPNVWQRTRARIAAANRVVFMRAPPFRRAARCTWSARIAIEDAANHKDVVRLRFDSAGRCLGPVVTGPRPLGRHSGAPLLAGRYAPANVPAGTEAVDRSATRLRPFSFSI